MDAVLDQIKSLLPLLPSLLVPYIVEYAAVGGRRLKRTIPRWLRRPVAVIIGATLAALAGGLTGHDLTGPLLGGGLVAGASSSGFAVGKRSARGA